MVEGAAAAPAAAEEPAEPAEEAKAPEEDDYSATEDEVRYTFPTGSDTPPPSCMPPA